MWFICPYFCPEVFLLNFATEYIIINIKAIKKVNQQCYFSNNSTSHFTGVIQLIPPVLSSETLLHILLSSEYSGFRPSTTAVVIIGAPISVPTGPTDRR